MLLHIEYMHAIANLLIKTITKDVKRSIENPSQAYFNYLTYSKPVD